MIALGQARSYCEKPIYSHLRITASILWREDDIRSRWRLTIYGNGTVTPKISAGKSSWRLMCTRLSRADTLDDETVGQKENAGELQILN